MLAEVARRDERAIAVLRAWRTDREKILLQQGHVRDDVAGRRAEQYGELDASLISHSWMSELKPSTSFSVIPG